MPGRLRPSTDRNRPMGKRRKRLGFFALEIPKIPIRQLADWAMENLNSGLNLTSKVLPLYSKNPGFQKKNTLK